LAIVVAAELQAARCVIAAVRRAPDEPPTIVSAASFPFDDELAARLRAFRRAWRLPLSLRLVHWPRRGDAGVVHPSQRIDGGVRMPAPSTIRDRARPIIQSGFKISSVVLPHQVLRILAERIGARDRLALLLERRGGCIACASDRHHQPFAAYFWWPASQSGASGSDETSMGLARYRFASQLGPPVRDLLSRTALTNQLFACGGLPNLRVAVMPLAAEIEAEIEVLDTEFPNNVRLDAGVADDATPASFQVAVALASQ
jgi:hypothetical protein